jgi:hypothetical protein
VIHARRVSGIPASLKKTLDERRRSAAFRQQSQVLESPSLRPQADVSASSGLAASPPALTEMLAELNDDDEPAGGMRRDVSTPRGKAASLLHRLQEDRDRRVLSPRDANAPVAE